MGMGYGLWGMGYGVTGALHLLSLIYCTAF